MKPRILLVNPPIYDFAAYDFWLKPYGLLSVAGYLRGKAEFLLFDYLDRCHEFMAGDERCKSDEWGRGRYYFEKIEPPEPLKDIPRYYRRFALPRKMFQKFLQENEPCEYVFVQTTMTYWYPGYAEVIEDVRRYWGDCKIILGGCYVSICSEHAKTLGSDLLVHGTDLKGLFKMLNIEPDLNQPALWEAYDKLKVGVIKLSDGCPFYCTYCCVPEIYGKFKVRTAGEPFAQLQMLIERGVENVAFYDDALLFHSETVLKPFLKKIIEQKIKVNLHTPNALNARFITEELSELMVEAGFKTFYLGFESLSKDWQQQTGAKVFSEELAKAVENLLAAAAHRQNITAYQILGHPAIDIQQLEESMRFVNGLGIRGMLADFSPIPGTVDGQLCRKWVDLDEPLMHNKTAFPIIMLGFDEVNRLKDLQRKLNRSLGGE